ncbi:MAG TPA: hypothetical protein VK618_14050 [Flavitalea sp.]|nr:hypothetical protein [Flavitalea sp.]
MRKNCNALSIISALLISLFIYVFYRSEETVVNEIMILILSFDRYIELKRAVTDAIPLGGPVVFSLPGGLWVFCVTTLSKNFFIKVSNFKVQIVLVPVFFAIGLEFCQLLHFTNGRFDLWDLVFYVSFWLLAAYPFRFHESEQNILSPFTIHGFTCLACFASVYLAHVIR